MATLTISPDVQTQLHDVAARAGRAPDELAAEVLTRGLEDWTDYLAAIDVARAGDPSDRVSHEELMARYGLAD